ncbi:MAG: KH domain-containing protein [Bacilli bacterium]|nr:KH domain-containing protein [Bacilli bacterium]
MDLVQLTEYIVKSIVVNKESVSVKEFETDEENTTLIQVLVDSEDIGRVLGKQRRMANSIRTLVQASSSLQNKGRVRIEVDNF